MAESAPPLALDVDNTFLKTDLGLECFFAALSRAPGATLRILAGNCFRPAQRRAKLAALAGLRTDLLPARPEIAALARECRSAGREVVLVSSADAEPVRRLAVDHGLSQRVFASREGLELRGERKAAALMAAFGASGFDYAGDSAGDWVIWRHAQNALLIGRHPRVERRLIGLGKSVSVLPGGWNTADLLVAMRPADWWKSLLILVAPLAAHHGVADDAGRLLAAILAFTALSVALYLFGDLADLNSDRQHPLLRHRPLASGRVPLGVAIWSAGALAVLGLFVVAGLGAGPFFILLLFAGIGVAYALRLKRLRWVDLATAASLNLVRVLAGAVVLGVALTGPVMLFLFAVFLTLACAGRLRVLGRLPEGCDDPLPGSAWGRRHRGDLVNVAALGVVGALASLWFYSLSAEAARLYPAPSAILLAGVPFAAWLLRRLRAADFARAAKPAGGWRRHAADAALLLGALVLLVGGSGILAGL